jgi:putative tricarboxylic transport membrane protein
MMGVFFQGIERVIQEPLSFVFLFFGVIFGIIFGCIPGLTATLGVILLIPVTYSMTPTLGMATLIGIYVGGISGGLITATLLNIPGTPSSIFTCWDAYPMSKAGYPNKALSIGVFASLFGGIVSALVLSSLAPELARVGLMFGNWELFALIFMAMSIVAVMTEGDTVRSTLGLVVGLLLGAIGIDKITGLERLTFGQWQLSAGLSATAIMMGLYAINEMLQQVKTLRGRYEPMPIGKTSFLPPFKELKGSIRTLLVGSAIGTFIGILPAVGQQTASLMTYNQAKYFSKEKETFGKGNPEGIVASEVANNAVCGGALIPLITLGIPGDMTTAALIGGLMIHGLQPGPLLIKTAPDIVGAVMVVYFLANIFMYVLEIGLMKTFVRMINIPKSFLFPFIFLCCFMGVFALNNRVFDMWVLIAFGIFGYVLSSFKVPMTPIIMGYLMGPILETNFRRAMVASQGRFDEMFARPIAIVFFAVGVFILVGPPVYTMAKRMWQRASK